MKEVRWEYLKGRDAAARLKRKPVVYLPIGCLERHGDHLPMGLDVLKAHAVCCECARKVGGVVFPPHFYAGIQFQVEKGAREDRQMRRRAKQRLAGWHNLYCEKTSEAHLAEILEQIAEMGTRVVVLYTGHYPLTQRRMVRRLASRFNRRKTPMRVIPFDERSFFGAGDHAGKWETSIFMALCPEHVDMARIKAINYNDHGWSAENDPKQASAAFGKQAIRKIISCIKKQIVP